MSLNGFSERLTSARRDSGLTQAELAGKLGVTAQAVSRWERGNSYPDIGLLDALVTILDYSPNALLQFVEKTKPFMDKATTDQQNRINRKILQDKLVIKFGEQLIPLFLEEGKNIYLPIQLMREKLAETCGFLVPPIRMMDELSLGKNCYEILLDGEVVGTGIVYSERNFFMNERPCSDVDVAAIEPVTGHEGIWAAKTGGIAPFQMIMSHLKSIIESNYEKIIDRQIVSDFVNIVRVSRPAIVDGVIPEKISLGRLQAVLCCIVKVGYGIRMISKIIEVVEDNPQLSVEEVTREFIRGTDEAQKIYSCIEEHQSRGQL